ncbi:MAG: hypothetical protein HUU01_09810 [Saprospiraceae bacterium]|nr:hypothetical protein [Saprospiraceae bacterium]
MAWYKYVVFMGGEAQNRICDLEFNTTSGKITIPVACLTESEYNAPSLGGEHDLENHYWEVKLYQGSYDDTGARTAIITEVSAPQTNDYLRFRIKRLDSNPPVIQVKRAESGTYSWFAAIGSEDIRIQMADDVAVGHFGLEGSYGPIFHYLSASDEYEVLIPV